MESKSEEWGEKNFIDFLLSIFVFGDSAAFFRVHEEEEEDDHVGSHVVSATDMLASLVPIGLVWNENEKRLKVYMLCNLEDLSGIKNLEDQFITIK